MPLHFVQDSPDALPLYALTADEVAGWIDVQPEPVARWVRSTGFEGAIGQAVAIPDAEGGPGMAVVGLGTAAARARGRFPLAAGMARLPEGDYRIEAFPAGLDKATEALGVLLAGYAFDAYRTRKGIKARLVLPADVDGPRIEAVAAGEKLTRDLINTPANDMGPQELEDAARALAEGHGAQIRVITGDALLDEGFPLIHTVGRAATRAPRLIDMSWGKSGPKVTLVGKGVCFDTGGLNLKPGGSMGLMKKDMGGAANVLGLASMLMATSAGIRLRVLIPAVENAVAGNAFRPGDILPSRKGLTVEINNTDAEGRLVLADALALACEDGPDAVISMATLTGAARVAVGPDLAPFYTDAAHMAGQLADAAARVADPVWQMPFHAPYEAMIEPGIADLDNAPKGGFAGSITAALFLRRFVTDETPYMHFDIYGWQPSDAPARPKGGVGQGIRFDAMPDLVP
jgi:leucyl aminopeptidase